MNPIEVVIVLFLGITIGCGICGLAKSASPLPFEDMMRDEEQEEFLRKLKNKKEEDVEWK